MDAEGLSPQEKLDRYCIAKVLAWRAALTGLGHNLTDPDVIPVKAGLQDLRDRQTAFREKLVGMTVIECDLGD